jgi:hypothetical protein
MFNSKLTCVVVFVLWRGRHCLRQSCGGPDADRAGARRFANAVEQRDGAELYAGRRRGSDVET